MRTEGKTEIRSQLEEMRRLAMFEKIVRNGGRIGLHRDVDKDRDFTAWYESLYWYDDIKQDEQAYENWMLADLEDLYESVHDHDSRRFAEEYSYDYGELYNDEYSDEYSELFSRANWRIRDLDSIRSGANDFDLMIRCRRLHHMCGGQPESDLDACSSSWKADWLLGYVDHESLSDDYIGEHWTVDGEDKFFENELPWWVPDTYVRTADPLGADRIAEKAKAERRFHRSHPLRGRRAA